MTCPTCLEKLIAYRDNLLSATEQQQIEAHLEECLDCQSQWQQLEALEDRIVRNAEHWQQISLEEKVLDRILNQSSNSLKTTSRSSRFWQIGRKIMKSPKTRIAAAAVVALAITITAFLSPTVSAQQILKEAIEAVSDIHAVHMKARMRTLPRDNFAYIGLQLDFVPIEMWRRLNQDGLEQWRIEKPGRVVVVDGVSTTLLIHPNHFDHHDKASPLGGCYDTWFGPLLNVEQLLDSELKAATNRLAEQMCLIHDTIEGRDKTILKIEKQATVSKDDYLYNKFIFEADRSIIYQFDTKSKLLESLHIFVHTEEVEVLVFEVTDIDYNSDIKDSVFTVEIPDDAILDTDVHILPDNEHYEAMSPKEMATTFFQACSQEDWDEVLKFMTTSRISEGFKNAFGGLTVMSIGEPFQSERNTDSDLQWFVPYEIQLRPTERYVLVSNNNAAGRNVIMGWYDSDLQPLETQDWQNEPSTLASESPYATLSPEEVVATFATALININYDTMGLFLPAEEIESMRGHFQEAINQNIDLQKMLPRVEVIRSFWSEEHQGTFVVTSESCIRSHNLAIRKDNDAHRFVVDGGL